MGESCARPCIVVPVYRRKPSLDEECSFKRLCRVLGSWPIFLAAPRSFAAEEYHHLASASGGREVQEKHFEDHFFTGTESYSRLLLDRDFYERFTDYSHILIYQLDAYVFRDELEAWCGKGYDYIGAPWFPEFTHTPAEGMRPWRTGNGGFSLRSVAGHLELFRRRRDRSFFELYARERTEGRRSLLRRLSWLLAAGLFGVKNNSRYLMAHYPEAEDRFWSEEAPRLHAGFRVAPPEEALAFAFEVAPAYCLALNGGKLPFGCHAWPRHDREFWAPYLQEDAPLPESGQPL